MSILGLLQFCGFQTTICTLFENIIFGVFSLFFEIIDKVSHLDPILVVQQFIPFENTMCIIQAFRMKSELTSKAGRNWPNSTKPTPTKPGRKVIIKRDEKNGNIGVKSMK